VRAENPETCGFAIDVIDALARTESEGKQKKRFVVASGVFSLEREKVIRGRKPQTAKHLPTKAVKAGKRRLGTKFV
jgi:hypothetical protein